MPCSSSQSLLSRIDRAVLRFELGLAGICVAGIGLLMLANVVLRGIGRPLIWGDELAVNLMVWSALLGASIAIATRRQVAVDLLSESLKPRARVWLGLGVDALVCVAVLLIGLFVWRWFDLPGLIRAGSPSELSMKTFNFIYQEPTLTLGVPKVVFWSVLPLFCLCAACHALSALYEDIACLVAERRA
ncbi:TRAP transporter small permease [Celeribacter persicus]|uniref:TRAP transporter small permease protein n=1 Tax=Celeribacter persicus TaxID=1651082 RepID=A0A2T5H422_9RHOB|nr:TRAP transporter small permease subunit [Celeribacter persicus]PTQ66361.1 tripartite ATP-independent transporter DctQ subunit [Celeribacter persicus]